MHHFPRSILVFIALIFFCTNSDKKEPAQKFTHTDVEESLALSKNIPVSTPAVSTQEYENPAESETDTIVQETNPVCDSIFNEELHSKRNVHRISTIERNEFFRAYFSTPDPNCDEGSYSSLIPGIHLNGEKFCEFYGNPMHLCSVYTTFLDKYENKCYKVEGIHTLLATVLKLPDSLYDKNSCDTLIEIGLGKITGIPPVLSKLNYKHINPAIIEWGIKNMLPAPDDSILGKSCREIYLGLYATFMRNLYLTLCWLEFSPDRIANEYSAYMDSCKSPSFSATRYLADRFYRNNPNESEGRYFFQPSPIYAGFWLRRFGDGSYQTMKNAVLTILEIYDKDVFSDVFYKDKLNETPFVNEYERVTSIDTMILSFIDFDLYIEGCVKYYDTPDSKGVDTIFLHKEDYICSDDKLLSVAIRKQKKISDVTVTVTGKWGFFVQGDPGKGGIGMDGDFGLIPAEKVSFQLADIKSRSLENVFKRENLKMSDDLKKELKRREEMFSANRSWNEVEPAEMLIDLKWNETQTDKNKHKVIKVEYSYGD